MRTLRTGAAVTGFKYLYAGRQPLLGRGIWTPFRARSVRLPLRPGEHGIHYCSVAQLSRWPADELWRFEDLAPDDTIEHQGKLVTSRGRITARVEEWTPALVSRFGFYCVDRARGHAVEALRKAGLDAEADRLAKLPAVTDRVATRMAAFLTSGETTAPASAAIWAWAAAVGEMRWTGGATARYAAAAAGQAERAAEHKHLSAWIAEECGL